jgi:predicted glycoside hydrolase/deacetylase ChbG (UPF0249 family)
MKRLIVNADDLGRSAGVNRGILRAHREGIVTSTTLMANAPRAKDAAALVREQRDLGVGVHLVLTFAQPLSPPEEVPSLVRAGGAFPKHPQEIRGRVRGEEALTEFRRQIERATTLLGRPPTHLDTHHFVQEDDEVLWALMEVARELDIPARHKTPAQRERFRSMEVRTTDHFCDEFYGRDAVTAGRLVEIIRRLPAGTTELMCHPGEIDDELRTSSYAQERPLEVAALTDPAVRRAIDEASISLISFREL